MTKMLSELLDIQNLCPTCHLARKGGPEKTQFAEVSIGRLEYFGPSNAIFWERLRSLRLSNTIFIYEAKAKVCLDYLSTQYRICFSSLNVTHLRTKFE